MARTVSVNRGRSGVKEDGTGKKEEQRQCSFIFFSQAEDGKRGLVRSRGVGGVYKRQGGGRFSLRNGLWVTTWAHKRAVF